MPFEVPSNPRPTPPGSAVRYHEGNSCPLCGQAVEFVQHDPGRIEAGPDAVVVKVGGRGGTLFPCCHRVDLILAPGNRQ